MDLFENLQMMNKTVVTENDKSTVLNSIQSTKEFISNNLKLINDQAFANVLREIIFQSNIKWKTVQLIINKHMPEVKIESLEEDIKIEGEDKPLKVCDKCLAGIESTQGNQYTTRMNPDHYNADEEDDESGELLYKCDWCEDLFLSDDLNEFIDTQLESNDKTLNNRMTITVYSGLNADGFIIKITNNDKEVYKERYMYGLNSSYDKHYANEKVPYVSDIIKDLMNKYNVNKDDIDIIAGKNVFKGTLVDDKTVESFKEYLDEIKEVKNRR